MLETFCSGGLYAAMLPSLFLLFVLGFLCAICVLCGESLPYSTAASAFSTLDPNKKPALLRTSAGFHFSFVIEKSVLPIGLAELPRDHLAISRVVDEVVPRGRLGHLDQLPLGLLQALYGSDPERLAIR
jgi:hypothetical protein